jgi:hypothetical protein
MNNLMFGAGMWSWGWGSIGGTALRWDWTFGVALLVSVFSAGHALGWSWCWVGPAAWSAAIGLRILVRLPVAALLRVRPDEIRIWFLGDAMQVLLPRTAWRRMLFGVAGPIATGSAWAVCLSLPQDSHAWVWSADIFLAFTLLHLIPLPPFDGAWLSRGLLMSGVGVRRAALWSTILGFIVVVCLALWYAFLGAIVTTICFIIFAYLAWRMMTEIQNGNDPLEDLPLPSREPGVIDRWRTARAAAAETRSAAARADEDALLDRLLAKVSTEGLPSLTESERRQLHAISERRRQESP